ncbi:molybdopterin-dependent oxidoreductase [Derxia lacustris]|uniref:molybdopterin-dependent oxidoreductase n=1 Tax=Derxia lacustris TaxID=764842 RepID=UPI00111C508F|nr:molybdopterin-dependent oxidoreductase [Derxia lacustris]
MSSRPEPRMPRSLRAALTDVLADGLRSLRRNESALPDNARRNLLRGSLSLGGLSLLSGCQLVDEASVESALMKVSRFNDRAQAALFGPDRLAPTYPDSMIVRPFPFNAFYGEEAAPDVAADDWRLEVGGKVGDRGRWNLAALRQLPQTAHTTRHICVEGWSAIGNWGGVPLGTFLRRVGADLGAKYVDFRCADGYHTSLDMPTALHPQTLLVLDQDGAPLPRRNGAPLKLRVPTKLGYKNPKHIVALTVTDAYPGGYWEDQGYNWFGGS